MAMTPRVLFSLLVVCHASMHEVVDNTAYKQ